MKIKSTRIILLISLTLGLSLISCNNFLKAEEVKNDIENQITYANAESYLIKVDYTRNTGIVKSPAGAETEKKVTDIFTICFEPSTDYEFIHWKIIDSVTKKEYKNGEYVELASLTDSETRCTMKKAPEAGMNLCLFAVVAERPQVISYTPITSNTSKDSTIQVMFDFVMDPASLYYTKEEMDALKKEGTADEGIFAETLNGKTIYRGYKKDGLTYYKNVIIRNNKTQKNFNEFFNPPVLENDKVISITANKKKLVDSYSQILVTIEKGIFYTVKVNDNITKNIEMAGSKKWMYQVSGKGDDDALVVSQESDKDVFDVKFTDETSLEQEAIHTVDMSTRTGLDTLKFVKDDKLKLKLQVNDINNCSGPASTFKKKKKKIYNENYAAVSEENEHELDFQVYTSEFATFEDTLDLSEWGITDGVYEMYFTFKDRSENSLTYPLDDKKYYIARDNIKPVVKSLSMSSTNNTTYTTNWTTSIADVKSIEYSVKTDDGSPVVTSLAGDIKTNTVNDIAMNKKYEIKLLLKDYAGNETEAIFPKFLTGCTLEGTPTFTGNNASHISDVFFTNDYISYYGLSLKKYYSDGSSVDLTSSTKIPTKTSYSTKDKLSFSVTENGVTKTVVTSSSYYTAKKDSLTQTPEYICTRSGYSCYKFGDYPQEISKISSYSSNTVYNGWYLGSDGYFYELRTTNLTSDTCRLSTTSTSSTKVYLEHNETYHFKVMPIEWRCLTSNYNGKKLLVAEKCLDQCQYYYNWDSRNINGKTIPASNYRYSTLRAFLNGKYESGDPQPKTYSNNGFLQKAFTTTARDYIKDTTVVNDKRSTNPNNNAYEWSNGENPFACENTTDKIFALSVQEATTSSYGYNASVNAELGGRIVHSTDYAKAKTVWEHRNSDNSSSNSYGCNWLLRSPRDIKGIEMWRVTAAGQISFDEAVEHGSEGVRPALCIN